MKKITERLRIICHDWWGLILIGLLFVLLWGPVVCKCTSMDILRHQVLSEPVSATAIVSKTEYYHSRHSSAFRHYYFYYVHGIKYCGSGFLPHSDNTNLNSGTKIRIIFQKSNPSNSIIAEDYKIQKND